MPGLTRESIPWRELPFLRAREVAAVLGVSETSVRLLIEEEAIEVRCLGRSRLIVTSSLVAWIEGENPQESTKPARKLSRAGLNVMREFGGRL